MDINEKHEKPKRKPVPNLEEICDLPAGMRDDLLRGFAQMTDAEKMDVLELQLHLIRSNLKNFRSSPPLALGTLCEALAKRKASTEILSKKGDGAGTPDRLLKMRVQSLKRNKGEGIKENAYRVRFHALVCDLRKENLGWRKCSEYLKKYHRFEISYSRLKILYEKYSKIGAEEVDGMD